MEGASGTVAPRTRPEHGARIGRVTTRAARPGVVVVGGWLREQLVGGHVTYVSRAEMRTLRSGGGRRLLVHLDVERFSGTTWRRMVDDPLLTTLGIAAAKPYPQPPPLGLARAR